MRTEIEEREIKRERDIELESEGKQDGNKKTKIQKHFIIFVRGAEQW